MAVNAVLKYLRDCGIEGQDAQQAWIAKVFNAVTAQQNHIH